MAASRYECPRCQTVFVKDSGDAAFVECPSCGALALPAGDATEGALERALSGPQPGPQHGQNGLPGGYPPMTPGLPSTEAEQPALGSGPDPMASSPGSNPAATAEAGGIFAGLLDSEPGAGIAIPPAALGGDDGGAAAAPEPPSGGGGFGPELDFNFGTDVDLDLPSFPAPPTPGAGVAAPARAGDPFRASTSPPVSTLPPDALAALAEDAEAGPTDAKPAQWSGLSEEAFGDLEKAFDEMALKPAPPPPRGGLSADEERFLRGDSGAGRPPPLRRVDGEVSGKHARPPPPPRRAGPAKEKRPRPTHFQISAEARTLAFVPLRFEEVSGATVRPRLDRRDVPSGPPVEITDPATGVPQRPAPRPGVPVEATDVVRAPRDRPAKKPVPSAWKGLSFGRVAALVILFSIIGGGVGALTAPKPKAAATARARAELRFADGNRFYDAGRFDDALGAFRGALSIDPTFALAHRAKGASLAKLQRWDEAAEAYEEYLKLEPEAVDVTDVKAALVRRGPPPKPGGSDP
jgi:tetratricopeptide (TPR) repeat protein